MAFYGKAQGAGDAWQLHSATLAFLTGGGPDADRLVWSWEAFKGQLAPKALRPWSEVDGIYAKSGTFYIVETKTHRETARQNTPCGNWWKNPLNELDGLRRTFRERFTPVSTGAERRAHCAKYKWAFVLAQLRHAIVTHLYHHDPVAPGMVYRPMFVIPEHEQENFDHAYRICDSDLRAHGTGPVAPLKVRGPYTYVDREGRTIPVVALEIPVDNYFGFQPRTQAIPPIA